MLTLRIGQRAFRACGGNTPLSNGLGTTPLRGEGKKHEIDADGVAMGATIVTEAASTVSE